MRATWKHIRIINLPRNTNVDVSRKQYFRMKSFLLRLWIYAVRYFSVAIPVVAISVRGNREYIIRRHWSTGRDSAAASIFPPFRCCHVSCMPHRRIGDAIIRARSRGCVPSNIARFHSTRINGTVRRLLTSPECDFHLYRRNFYLYKWNFLLEQVELYLYKRNFLFVQVKLIIACTS
jgi:hypothetical protein